MNFGPLKIHGLQAVSFEYCSGLRALLLQGPDPNYDLSGVPGYPKPKSEPDPNYDSGEISCPKSKSVDTRNPTDNPKPEFFYKSASRTTVNILATEGVKNRV